MRALSELLKPQCWSLRGVLISASLLAGCGGGEQSDTAQKTSAPTNLNVLAAEQTQSLAQSDVQPTSAAPTLEVAGVEAFEAQRISRTAWKYTLKVRVKNKSTIPLAGKFTLLRAGAGTSIVEATFRSTGMAPGAEAIAGEVTVIHDRLYPFAPASWQWSIDDLPIDAIVQIAADVPHVARARLAKTLSVFGESAIGYPLKTTFNTRARRALVIGIDQDGRIVLMTTSSSSDVVLSSETTALAILSVMKNSFVDVTERDAFESYVTQSSDFSLLVEAVKQALAEGGSPIDNEKVSERAAGLLSRYYAAISIPNSATVANAGNDRRRALAVVSTPRAEPESLPYAIVPDSILGAKPVAVSGTCFGSIPACSAGSATDLAVKNTSPIYWSYRTTSAVDGSIISSGVLTPGENIPAKWAASWAIDPLTVTVPQPAATNGKPVNLQLIQDRSSRVASLQDVMAETLILAVEFVPSSWCDLTSVKEGIKASIKGFYDSLGTPSSLEVFTAAYLEALKNPSLYIDLFATCGESISAPLARIAKTIDEAFLKPWSTVTNLYSASLIAAKYGYLYKYWNAEPSSVGICINKLGSLSSCVTKIEYTPNTLHVSTGVRLDLSTEAMFYGLDGKTKTIPPSTLTYSTPGTLIALNPNTGAATVVGTEGLSGVTVTDNSTGVSGGYGVMIERPMMAPAMPSVDIGGKIDLNIVGNATSQPLIVPPGGVFRSEDPDIADINLVLSLLLKCKAKDGACVVVDGKKAGTTRIWYEPSTLAGSEPVSIMVTVNGSSPITFWEIKEMICDEGTCGFLTGGFDSWRSGETLYLGDSASDLDFRIMFSGNNRQANNTRLSTRYLCTSAGGIDIERDSHFDIPWDVAGSLTPVNEPNPIVYNFQVTSRQQGEIIGTIEIPSYWYYETIIVDGKTVRQKRTGAVTRGRWRATPYVRRLDPNGPAGFAKCTYPSPANACVWTNVAYQRGGAGGVGSCDWKPRESGPRSGEWSN